MSDTPRTDEQINGKPCTRFEILAGDSLRNAAVPSEFARTIERELNAAQERIKRLEEAGDALMEIVEGARSERWNVNGFRLKDTPEWVQFYVSFRKAKRSKWKEAKP